VAAPDYAAPILGWRGWFVVEAGGAWGAKIRCPPEKSAICRQDANFGTPQGAERIDRWRRDHDVYAYFKNDREGSAVRNALRLKERLGV
jgi:hypothetical protein